MLVDFLPETSDSISPSVSDVLVKIEAYKTGRILLVGFGSNMQWLASILDKAMVNFELADWRGHYEGYDCCDHFVQPLSTKCLETSNLLVLCADTTTEVEEGTRFLIDHDLTFCPTVFGIDDQAGALNLRPPFKSILERAKSRARTMISDEQLVEIIQIVSQTASLESPVVEFGTLYGGTAAVWAEALFAFGERPLWIFDSFKGIPPASNGLDHRWTGAFAGSSEAVVRTAFSDLSFVEIVSGNILTHLEKIPEKLSVAYIASDTFETGRALLEVCWDRLEAGGVLIVCDYRSYPNCVPLTAEVDRFFCGRVDAFQYLPSRIGFWAIKR